MAELADRTNISIKYVGGLTVLLLLVGIITGSASALPPPKTDGELFRDSDLVIEGRVTQVSPYSQWLTSMRQGGAAGAGPAAMKDLPDSDEALLRLMDHFPYGYPHVIIDGAYIAAVKIEKVVKGDASGTIFIPFARYHFPPDRHLVGPWAERPYKPGERWYMYLKKKGPFYQSTWWNAVRALKSQ